MSENSDVECPLCLDDGGLVIARAAVYRIVLPQEPMFPGFTRVISTVHARELTDLEPADRHVLMAAVYAVESAMRAILAPLKINVASRPPVFSARSPSVVPHVHWHIIPRWADDSHFPRPVWAEALRPSSGRTLDSAQSDLLIQEILKRLEA